MIDLKTLFSFTPAKVVRAVLFIAVLAYFVTALVLWRSQEYLIFPALEWQSAIRSNPPIPPAGIESFFVSTPDGEKLNVWTTDTKNPALDAPYVGLIFHGNGETVASMNYLPFFARHGIPAFTFDYRGYGESTGWPSEEKMEQDAQTVWEAIQKRTGKNTSQLIILGNSLGSAPASHLASVVSPRALIIIAGFSSMPEVLKNLPLYRPFLWALRYQFDNVSKLSKIKVDCAFLAHGKKDPIIPFDHQGRLENALSKSSAKEVVILNDENASHTDIYYAVENQLNATVDKCLGTTYNRERWP